MLKKTQMGCRRVHRRREAGKCLPRLLHCGAGLGLRQLVRKFPGWCGGTRQGRADQVGILQRPSQRPQRALQGAQGETSTNSDLGQVLFTLASWQDVGYAGCFHAAEIYSPTGTALIGFEPSHPLVLIDAALENEMRRGPYLMSDPCASRASFWLGIGRDALVVLVVATMAGS